MKRVLCLTLALVIFFSLVGSAVCQTANAQSIPPKYQSYRDIPGVTQEEISAVEELLARKPVLVYGASVTTEAFLHEDGSVGGFSTLFTNRMSELFGFDFTVCTFIWNDLVEGIVSKKIDFTGEFTATPERLKIYFMTDPIVQRSIKVFTYDKNQDLLDIAKERPIKCAFLDGSTMYSVVKASWDLPFEPVLIEDEFLVPNMLLNGEIDAFIEEGIFEACFDSFDFIKADEYYPLTYSPVSLTTGNPELEPIISVMQKYLKNGGYDELIEFYNQGYNEYLKNKLYIHLTEAEKDYIRSHNTAETAISIACETSNYPMSFYNEKEKEFQGVALDVLDQVSALTGLQYKVGNKIDTSWMEILEGLENGTYSVVTELLQTNPRKGRFLWTAEPYYTDYYAMISRADYPDTDINRISLVKVGLLEDTAYTDVFLEWFPDNTNTVMYPGKNDAIPALENGEIDLLMVSQTFLLHLVNYLEKPNFKANIVFRYSAGSSFGFNKDEEILCSIINKAQLYIDTGDIAESWQRKVFDYQSKMLRDMLPYAVAFSIILLAALIVVFVLLMKNRRINKNLDETVSLRTNELEAQAATLERRLEQQRVMATLSQNFITGEDIDEQITESLRLIGEFMGISRVMLMKFDGQALKYLYEWNNPSQNIKPKMGMTVPLADMELQITAALSQKIITHFNLDDAGRDDLMRRYQLDDIKNFLLLPVFIGDKIWGALDFAQCDEYTPWTPSDINLGEMVAGILSGVLNRRQMEEELALQTSTLKAMFESIPDIVFCKDLNLNFTRCNRSFEKHFNQNEEYLIGKDDVSGLGIPFEIAEQFREADRKVIREQRPTVVEEIIPAADGTSPLFETVKVPLTQDGKVIGIMGISRDITQRKAAEETLKLTLDNLDACVYITEIETGKILFINNRMVEEYHDADCVGKKCWEVLQKGRSKRCEFCAVPKLIETGDKDYVWEKYSAVTGKHYKNTDSIIKWHDGRLVHMQHSVDITNLINLQKDLENASKAKGDFLSRMSHEIRTPLNAIIGMVNIAMATDDNGKIQDCLIKAGNASKHLLGVINDILDMSKIEADKFELDSREFSFEKMLMNVTNITNFRAEEKKQNFIVNLNRNVPESIIGDDLRLSQVITNLLTNAVKFTPEEGTVILSIDKTADNGDEVTLRIEIEDDGIGISEEQQKRLFTSFEQADGGIARKFGGTGLGLAISKRIVELMDGRIWIESELGKGSKFIFTIKAGKGHEKTRAQLSEKINRSNMRILAVDDSLEIREYFKHVMESLGLPCEVAANGAEALAMTKNCGDKPYNIFFIDWQMPEMNGIELTKKIKETVPDNSVVFMITVAEWSIIEQEALAVGVRSFISKPLYPSTLVNAINECMEIEPRKKETGSEGSHVKKQSNFDGRTILIAEDVEINREIMSAVLEDTGINIDYAENGLMAVSMFQANPDKYSLILMDIHMPEMDGYEATRRIRVLGLPQAEDIPIIAMTANVFREDIENCLAAGMNDHIGKPVDQDDVFAKLRKYLK